MEFTPEKSPLTAQRRLLAIQALAGFSQWLDIFLIFSVAAFLWQATPTQMAFIASCFGLPGLFLGPFIGAMLDRLDARRSALMAALTRTALTVGIAFAGSFETFAVLVLLKGLANVFYWPATSILTQRLVGRAERVKYFSSLAALDQITKIATPLMAGTAAMFMDMQFAFVLSAMMTLLCALMIAHLPRSAAGIRRNDALAHAWEDLRAGWKLMTGLDPILTSSIALGIGMSLSLAIYDPHVAAWLHALQFAPGTFSLIVSSTAAGAVCGALWIRFFAGKSSSTRIIQAGIALYLLATAGMAILAAGHAEAINAPVLAAIWFISGVGYEIFVIGSSVTLQNLCPPALIGRVATSARSLQMLAVVTGPLMGAWLIGVQSRAAPFGVSALIACLLLLASLRCFPGHAPEALHHDAQENR